MTSNEIITTRYTHCVLRAQQLRELDIRHRALPCVVHIHSVTSNPLPLKHSRLSEVDVYVGGATLLPADDSYSIPVFPLSALATLNSTV